ncbi:unnamed protein product [Brachionus calyciflorus]|uniref:Calponin-homology (CH) domain-containing protein n=1 Tax=Brachionus calyciflorus TaxID=104777 RepID=A0A814BDT6_9BILA|nr:unnamed protein product [Brachionus calyciflorus]
MSLTAAVKRKIESKRDPKEERQAKEWIEAVIEEKFPNGKYEDALKDGVILCKLMNKLKPGIIAKFNTSGSEYVLRDNISQFLTAAAKYGVLRNDLFQTVDLFDQKDIALVTQSIRAVCRQAQRNGFQGPVWGAKSTDNQ